MKNIDNQENIAPEQDNLSSIRFGQNRVSNVQPFKSEFLSPDQVSLKKDLSLLGGRNSLFPPQDNQSIEI